MRCGDESEVHASRVLAAFDMFLERCSHTDTCREMLLTSRLVVDFTSLAVWILVSIKLPKYSHCQHPRVLARRATG